MNENSQVVRMKTICIGRFLIDVPETASIAFRPAFISGWYISVDGTESDEQFNVKLQTESADVQREQVVDGKRRPPSVVNIESASHVGKIFVSGREVAARHGGREIDSQEGVSIIGHVRVEGTGFSIAAKSRTPDSVNEARKIIQQVFPLAAGRIPDTSGFCIENGIVHDPLVAQDGEAQTLFVGLSGHPDVSIAVHTSTGNKPGPSLLARSDGDDVPEVVKVIRSSHRLLADLQGDEIVEFVREENGTRGQSFMWESQGTEDDAFNPFISIEMSTGHGRPGAPVMSSLSDSAAITLWDRILSSLRRRHDAHATR